MKDTLIAFLKAIVILISFPIGMIMCLIPYILFGIWGSIAILLILITIVIRLENECDERFYRRRNLIDEEVKKLYSQDREDKNK